MDLSLIAVNRMISRPGDMLLHCAPMQRARRDWCPLPKAHAAEHVRYFALRPGLLGVIDAVAPGGLGRVEPNARDVRDQLLKRPLSLTHRRLRRIDLKFPKDRNADGTANSAQALSLLAKSQCIRNAVNAWRSICWGTQDANSQTSWPTQT